MGEEVVCEISSGEKGVEKCDHWNYLFIYLFIFFFQAEDGIRDRFT